VTSAVADRIWQLHEEGRSYGSIARQLNGEGLRTPTGLDWTTALAHAAAANSPPAQDPRPEPRPISTPPPGLIRNAPEIRAAALRYREQLERLPAGTDGQLRAALGEGRRELVEVVDRHGHDWDQSLDRALTAARAEYLEVLEQLVAAEAHLAEVLSVRSWLHRFPHWAHWTGIGHLAVVDPRRPDDPYDFQTVARSLGQAARPQQRAVAA